MENINCNCQEDIINKVNQIQDFINGKLLDITEAECSRMNNEDERIKNETARQKAESNRITNENVRQEGYNKIVEQIDKYTKSEKGRQQNELERINNENKRQQWESCRKDAENIRKELESSRQAAETQRTTSEINRIENENNRVIAENKRSIAEQNRQQKELIRETQESIRQDNELIRKNQENSRIQAENIREENENNRVIAEEQREKVIADAKNTVKEAANVNAELDGTKVNITNRKGETKSLELVDIDEHVTVTMKTKISDVTLSGKVLNVFRNHGETPEQYTTNDQGVVTFSVTRGTYYEIHFPDVGIAQPIDPIGYTATLPIRNIEVEYIPAAEGPQEHVIIELCKALLDGTKEVFPNINFSVQINNGDIQNYTVDTQGQYQFDVPVNKKCTVTFTQQEGFYNTTTLVKEFTASSSNRVIRFIYYTYKNGIFIVTEDGQEYTLNQFKEQNLDKTTAKMIAVYERNLLKNNGVIYASIKDLSTADYADGDARRDWCNQEVLFKDIPEQGNDINAMYYYDGNGATTAILQEAKERTLVCNAATYARTKQITIDGNTMYGYLPSIGQIYTFQYNSTAIDEILKYIVGDSTMTVSNNFIHTLKWTSGQNRASAAWNYDARLGIYNKTNNFFVACFYAY